MAGVELRRAGSKESVIREVAAMLGECDCNGCNETRSRRNYGTRYCCAARAGHSRGALRAELRDVLSERGSFRPAFDSCLEIGHPDPDVSSAVDHCRRHVPGLSQARSVQPERLALHRAAEGKLNSTSSPPSGQFSALTFPPWRRTARSVIERPRPDPPEKRSRASPTR